MRFKITKLQQVWAFYLLDQQIVNINKYIYLLKNNTYEIELIHK